MTFSIKEDLGFKGKKGLCVCFLPCRAWRDSKDGTLTNKARRGGGGGGVIVDMVSLCLLGLLNIEGILEKKKCVYIARHVGSLRLH